MQKKNQGFPFSEKIWGDLAKIIKPKKEGKKKIEKILNFMIRGEWYQANEKGWIKRMDIPGFQFSDTWIFLGGSGHHWNNHITVRWEEVFKNPEKLIGCLLWDRDHGTIRVWGGSYCGRIPRVQSAYLENVKGGK